MNPSPSGATALARLYGEPLFELPPDLYIPPEALAVFLEAFEGPLDLLLYLIRKQHFNILDIPMAQVTRQYLGYVEQVRAHNLELAGEYLLMAALLIEIKSRLLLPPQRSSPEAEAQDPRAELVRRLLEYEQIKQAAQKIDQLPQLGRDFWLAQAAVLAAGPAPLPSISPSELAQAWSGLLQRAQLVQHHRIDGPRLSVRAFMSQILRQLQRRRFAEFGELFQPEQGLAVLIVNFIALLELAREGLIELTQASAYAPIYVRLGPGTGLDTPDNSAHTP
ncbi:segregation and condensation protein A [Serpentinimonas barnesii]|uniref:segregation and condensation protein A n=1 Tax=Serpentinimonas barnesii TaxID=1458427 RepID=UPI0005F03348|nr:ScpA family protein [Serpentinimonas barnesii]